MIIPWAPSRTIAVASIAVLILIGAICIVATNQPWLGVEFKADTASSGLVVVHVDPSSPNRDVLSPGDVVVGLASGQREARFDATLLPIGEVDLPNFATFNRYVASHNALWQALTSGDFQFVLANERRVRGEAAASRPVTDLSWRFWSLATAGFIALLIGTAIAVYRPRLPAAPVIVVGGVGMFIAAVLAGLCASRELTLPPFWLRFGIDEVNPGSQMIAFAFVALLWNYPRPLHRFPVAAVCVLFAVLVWLNNVFQLWDVLPHTFMLHFLVAYPAIVLLAVLQWFHTKTDALARAALQWFLLTIVVIASVFIILSVVPVAYGEHSLIAKCDTFFLGPAIYVGLAFGVARYRLFDIDRWWLEVWLWLGGGLLVIAIDVLLISFAHLANVLALAFALILAGWVYLPLRQWLFRRVSRTASTRLDEHFSLLLDTLFRATPEGSFAKNWQALVNRVFAPLSLTVVARPVMQTALAESGLALHVPSFDGNDVLELRYREKGTRLYSPHDAALADTLLELARRAAAMWQAREEGARTERMRITRDLHDDVAARLLSLVHRVPDPAQQAQVRETIGALRHVIYALDDQQPITVDDFLNEMQAQVRELLRDTDIKLEWHDPEPIPALKLSPRERINLARVVQEGVANAIRHARPLAISVRIELAGGALKIRVCNDGAIHHMKDWTAGKGLHNIRTRMAEIGGEVQWSVHADTSGKPQTCCIEVSVSLSGTNPP